MNSATVTWEAVYDNGHVDRERDGVRYANIDRNRLKSFRLVAPGEILCEMHASDGRSGHNLVYRRRTIHAPGDKVVWFLMGWVPMGPVVAIQPETEQVLKAEHFKGTAGPLGQMQATPEEKWFYSHGSDAMLKRPTITLPSGYVLNWR